MRFTHRQDYSVPPPGTTEAIELGCTCPVICHEIKADELEPAGMLCGSRRELSGPWQRRPTGEYSHARLRERLLGGVSYDLMHESPVPLLMAH